LELVKRRSNITFVLVLEEVEFSRKIIAYIEEPIHGNQRDYGA